MEGILNQIDLPFAELSGANLEGLDLSGSNFQYARFHGACLDEVTAQGRSTHFENAVFDHASCNEICLDDVHLNESSFNEATLESGHIINSILSYASCVDIDGANSHFTDSICDNVDFTNSSLRNADFDRSSLYKTVFFGANILNASFVDAKSYLADFRDVAANRETSFNKYSIYEQDGNDHDLERAIEVYRSKQRIFRENQILPEVQKYEIREQDARRGLSYHSGDYWKGLRLGIYKQLFMYSYSFYRPLILAGTIIVMFAFLYAYIGFSLDSTAYSLAIGRSRSMSVGATIEVLIVSGQVFLPGSTPDISLRNLKFLVTIEGAAGALLLSLIAAVLVQRARY